MSVFPPLTLAPAGGAGGGSTLVGASVVDTDAAFSAGETKIPVTSSSSARGRDWLGAGGLNNGDDASADGLSRAANVLPSSPNIDIDGLSRRGGGAANGNAPGGLEGAGGRNGSDGASWRSGSVANSSTGIDINGLSHRRLSGALGRFVGPDVVVDNGFVGAEGEGEASACCWNGNTAFVLTGVGAATPRVGST